MGLKERVMELIQQRDGDGLAALAVQERRSVRHLLGRLWDTDPEVRALAAHAIGAAAAARPADGVEICRRMIWALNDESGMNGQAGIAALGAIGRAAPQVMAPFVGPLASFAWDRGLRLEILGALAQIARSAPDLVRPHLKALRGEVDVDDTMERDAWERLAKLTGEHTDVE